MAFTKVLVTGNWDYRDDDKVFATLDQMADHYGDLLLIHENGAGPTGAAARWGGERRVVQARCPGLWGVKTDPDRKQLTAGMLALGPDICVVFGGDTRGAGTAAKAAGIPTYEID